MAQAEKVKASVQAKVEHAFSYIRRVFQYGKVRYRGLAKKNRLFLLSWLAHMLRMKSIMLP